MRDVKREEQDSSLPSCGKGRDSLPISLLNDHPELYYKRNNVIVT